MRSYIWPIDPISLLYNERPFPQIAPFYGRIMESHLTQFLGPIRAHNPNGSLIGSAVFAQMTADWPYTLQWDALFPQNCPFLWGSGPIYNAWFPEPTRVLNLNSIPIG